MPKPNAPDLYSIGRLAAQLQRSAAEIRRIADEANVRPVMTLNDIPYFRATALRDLAQKLDPKTR